MKTTNHFIITFLLLSPRLITDHIAIGINFHTAKGIILRDAQQIQLLKNSFIQERKIAKEMLFCSDLNAYVKDVNVMMNEGYVTHNYYIEYSPCLLHLIPLNVLKQQIFSLSADPAHGNGKYGTYFLHIWLTTINGAGTYCGLSGYAL